LPTPYLRADYDTDIVVLFRKLRNQNQRVFTAGLPSISAKNARPRSLNSQPAKRPRKRSPATRRAYCAPWLLAARLWQIGQKARLR
jgi:hypothetical protein